MLALTTPERSIVTALEDVISASIHPLMIRSSSTLSRPLMTMVGPIVVVAGVPPALLLSLVAMRCSSQVRGSNPGWELHRHVHQATELGALCHHDARGFDITHHLCAGRDLDLVRRRGVAV